MLKPPPFSSCEKIYGVIKAKPRTDIFTHPLSPCEKMNGVTKAKPGTHICYNKHSFFPSCEKMNGVKEPKPVETNVKTTPLFSPCEKMNGVMKAKLGSDIC